MQPANRGINITINHQKYNCLTFRFNHIKQSLLKFSSMKKFLLISVMLIFTGILFPQEDSANKVIKDPSSDQSILVGPVTVKGFSSIEFGKIYNNNFNSYEPAIKKLEPYKEKILKSGITIVLATWCPDTQKQLPRFLRIMEELDYPLEKIRMIAVDHEMEAPGINPKLKYNIQQVPTFIFYHPKSEEIGRIVEKPGKSLEHSIAEIYKGKNYDKSK